MNIQCNTNYFTNFYQKSNVTISENSQVASEFETEISMEEYKSKIWGQINSIPTHPSQKNTQYVITITDAAFERMKNDPEYEEKVLNSIYVNKTFDCGNAAPKTTVLYTDDTWEKSWGMTYGIADSDDDLRKDKDEKSLWDVIMESYEKAEQYYLETLKKHELLNERMGNVVESDVTGQNDQFSEMEKRFIMERYEKNIKYVD